MLEATPPGPEFPDEKLPVGVIGNAPQFEVQVTVKVLQTWAREPPLKNCIVGISTPITKVHDPLSTKCCIGMVNVYVICTKGEVVNNGYAISG
jgi:hypothetical protein